MRFCHVVTALFVVVAMTSAQAQEKYRVYFGTYTGGGRVRVSIACELNVKNGFFIESEAGGRNEQSLVPGVSSQRQISLCCQ